VKPLQSLLAFASLAVLFTFSQGRAYGFGPNCFPTSTATLREEVAKSEVVLFGQLQNAQKDGDNGSTELVITKAIKGGHALKDQKVARIPNYIPIPDPKNPPQFLVFGDVVDGTPQFFKGVQCNRAVLDYLKGVIATENNDRVKLMQYCFDFLENEDRTIADDAFVEFVRSSDSELNKVGLALSSDKLRKWLQDERTLPNRLPLYAFLLANTGNEKDEVLLRKLIDRLKEKNVLNDLDRILIAYTRLNPKNGWKYVCELFEHPETHFLLLNSGFKAMKYFHETQPEILTHKEVLKALSLALDRPNFTDLAVEYLRKCRCWELTEQILSLMEKKEFDLPINKRSILRYALQCPDAPAVIFVEKMRKTNPSRIAAAEEYLRSQESLSENKPRSEQR